MEENKNILDFIQNKKVEQPNAAYFEKLAQEVISTQEIKKPIFKKVFIWVAAAAAIAVAVFVFNYPQTSNSENPLIALQSIPTQTIEEYIELNIEEFEEELIAEFVEVENLSVLENLVLESEPQENTTANINFDNIDKQDILDYLDREGLDTEDLEDEFFI